MIQRRALLASPLALAACQSIGHGGRDEPSGPALRRIGLASCTDQSKPQPIWDAVLADPPDLFLFGGDNVYASAQPWSRAVLDAAYATQAQVPGFARLRQTVPHLAIWDDHDYGLNDGGAEFLHKQSSKDAFLQFWQVPADDERRRRDGIHVARRWGPAGQRLQVIALDARWFRSAWTPSDQRGAPGKERYIPDPDPALTMLGDAQWQWLEAQLRQDADVRLILSGIQVVADGHGYERWGNFPTERQRLYDLIGRTRARGVVLLSGDRHIGAIYRETARTPYPLHELTSSGVTHPWAAASEPGPNRLGDLVRVQHFGRVDVDWAARQLTLGLYGDAGQALHSHRIALADLQAR